MAILRCSIFRNFACNLRLFGGCLQQTNDSDRDRTKMSIAIATGDNELVLDIFSALASFKSAGNIELKNLPIASTPNV